jgi:hypothetical protein
MLDVQIEHAWPVIIGNQQIDLPKEMRTTLIEIIKKQDHVFTEDTYNEKITITESELFERKIYNLFDYPKYSDENEIKQVKGFEQIMSKVIRDYVHQAWGANKDCDIKIRGFGNVQRTFGRRTAPHYHHGWDGVLAHYLTAGEEFELETSIPVMDTEHSGDLLLLDPRPNNYVPDKNTRTDIIHITPSNGLTVIHPGYVWHETHTHTKAGIRVLVAISFNIITKNHDELPTTLDNPYRNS